MIEENSPSSSIRIFQLIFRNPEIKNTIFINQKQVACNDIRVLDLYRQILSDSSLTLFRNDIIPFPLRGAIIIKKNNQINIEAIYKKIVTELKEEFCLFHGQDKDPSLVFYFKNNINLDEASGIFSKLEIKKNSANIMNFPSGNWAIQNNTTNIIKRADRELMEKTLNSLGQNDSLSLHYIPINPLNEFLKSEVINIQFDIKDKEYLIERLLDHLVFNSRIFEFYEFSVKLYKDKKDSQLAFLEFHIWSFSKSLFDFLSKIKEMVDDSQKYKIDSEIERLTAPTTTDAHDGGDLFLELKKFIRFRCNLKILKNYSFRISLSIFYEFFDNRLKIFSKRSNNKTIYSTQKINSLVMSFYGIDHLSFGLMLYKAYEDYSKLSMVRRIGAFSSETINGHILFFDYDDSKEDDFDKYKPSETYFKNRIKIKCYNQLSFDDLKGNLEKFLNDF